MTLIESDYKTVNVSPEKVFTFLSDLDNHQLLMPGQVTDWWSDKAQAKLKIQGLGALYLKLGETIENSNLKIVPAVKPIVDMFLEWDIKPEGDNCLVKVIIHADLNMMMKLVASKPLQNLADFMANKVNDAINKTV